MIQEDKHPTPRMPEFPWMGILVLVVALGAFFLGRLQGRGTMNKITIVVKMDYGQKKPVRFAHHLVYAVKIMARDRSIDPFHGSTTSGIVRILLPRAMSFEDTEISVDLRTQNDCCLDRRGPAMPTERAGEYEVVLICYRDCGANSL